MMVANQQGRFVETNCRDAEPGAAYLAKQYGYYAQLEQQAASGEHALPVAVNLGDSTFPGALSRFLLAARPNGQTLGELLARIPWAAHVIGNRELALDQTELDRFAAEAREANLPLQAANLTCTGERQGSAFCEVMGGDRRTDAWSVVERGDVRLGVTSVVHPEARKLVSERRMEGLEIRDPKAVLEGLVPEMREDGIDIVVVLYHSVRGSTDLQARSLASEVDGIDVLVSSETLTGFAGAGEGGPTVTAGYMVAPKTGTFILDANSGHRRVVRGTLQVQRTSGERWRVASVDSENVTLDDMTPDPEIEAKLRELSTRFCADWGQPINADVELESAWGLEDFQTFLLNVLRFSSRSEVALYNKGAFRNGSRFPITGYLSLADVYAVIPFNNAMFVGQMKGSDLAAAAAKLDGELLAEGLQKDGDAVLVNGRPVDRGRMYRVATNQFVATGGDSLIDPEALKGADVFAPDWSEEPPIIADILIRWIRQQSAARSGDDAESISGRGSFPDLHRKPLWSFVGSVDAAYNQLTVVNPERDGAPAYQQSQLTVKSADQINLEGSGTVEADTRDHGWKTDFQVQYAQASVADEEGVTKFEETKDLIRLKSLYQFSGFRGGRWYVPSPYVEGQGESEFDPPDSRDWHKLLVTGIVGARFELLDPLNVKIGFNARGDVNQPDASMDVGLTTAYTLERVDLFGVLGHPVEFQSELEYFFNSITTDNIHELRSTSRLYYAFFGEFYLTTTFGAFAVRTEPVGAWGTNTELTFGLNYRFDTSVQAF
ncbi:MAG: 5'-nucleotidase C-terminal domain-containing protein [Myxococcota bacterium]